MKFLAIGLLTHCIFASVAAAYTRSGGLVTVDPSSRMLLDSEGRTLILHGVNAIYKVPPYLPDSSRFDAETSLNEDDIRNLVKWGFNFVRLGVMWEAVERKEGVYDTQYLNQVKNLI